MKNITWKYVKPLKGNAIEEFENEAQTILPSDIKTIVKEFNNGRPSVKLFDTETQKECEFKKLLSFNREDTENIYDFLNFPTSIEGLIAIANDPGGNLICIYEGKIVYWKHDQDTIEPLSDSLNDFLSKLY